jgi:hypothetical protein
VTTKHRHFSNHGKSLVHSGDPPSLAPIRVIPCHRSSIASGRDASTALSTCGLISRRNFRTRILLPSTRVVTHATASHRDHSPRRFPERHSASSRLRDYRSITKAIVSIRNITGKVGFVSLEKITCWGRRPGPDRKFGKMSGFQDGNHAGEGEHPPLTLSGLLDRGATP